MRNIKEMIFMDVTKLNLMERLKPTEKKENIRKVRIHDGNQIDDQTGWISRAEKDFVHVLAL